MCTLTRVALAALLMAGCEKQVNAVSTADAAPQQLETRRAALEQQIAQLTAGGAEVLDRAAFLQEQLGDVLAQLGRKSEAIAEYEKAAVGYGRTPEGTDMPRIRADRVQKKAEALRGPH